MATVTQDVDAGTVTVVMTNNEVAKVRSALAKAFSDGHRDFKGWLINLRENWDSIVTKQGSTNTFVVSIDDAKQFQDLTGQLREDGGADWDSDLNELDAKLHNLWLRPADQFGW